MLAIFDKGYFPGAGAATRPIFLPITTGFEQGKNGKIAYKPFSKTLYHVA